MNQPFLFPVTDLTVKRVYTPRPKFKYDGVLYRYGRPLDYFKMSSRVLYASDKRVYKISSPEFNTYNQSLAEWNLWNRLEKSDRKYFATCYDYAEVDDYYIITQKKYTPDDAFDRRTREKAEETLNKLTEYYRFEDVDDRNWFIVNGRLLIYDFGYVCGIERYEF